MNLTITAIRRDGRVTDFEAHEHDAQPCKRCSRYHCGCPDPAHQGVVP